MHGLANRFFDEAHITLFRLAMLWQSEGLVGAEVDATTIADGIVAFAGTE